MYFCLLTNGVSVFLSTGLNLMELVFTLGHACRTVLSTRTWWLPATSSLKPTPYKHCKKCKIQTRKPFYCGKLVKAMRVSYSFKFRKQGRYNRSPSAICLRLVWATDRKHGSQWRQLEADVPFTVSHMLVTVTWTKQEVCVCGLERGGLYSRLWYCKEEFWQTQQEKENCWTARLLLRGRVGLICFLVSRLWIRAPPKANKKKDVAL